MGLIRTCWGPVQCWACSSSCFAFDLSAGSTFRAALFKIQLDLLEIIMVFKPVQTKPSRAVGRCDWINLFGTGLFAEGNFMRVIRAWIRGSNCLLRLEEGKGVGVSAVPWVLHFAVGICPCALGPSHGPGMARYDQITEPQHGLG